MIFKDKIKIKDKILSADVSRVVETALNFVFRVNDDGTAEYTPYFMEDGLRFGIITYLLDGVEIEDSDDDVLGVAHENDQVVSAISDFKDMWLFDTIKEYVEQLAEFKKEEYLYRSSELNRMLMRALDSEIKVNEAAYKLAQQNIKLNEKSEEILNLMTPEEIAELNKKIASGELNPDSVANIAIEKYMATDKHDQNLIQTIDEKNKQIQELQMYKDAYSQEV